MRRRPFRWLAQLTLLVCAIAVVIVSLTGTDGPPTAEAESTTAQSTPQSATPSPVTPSLAPTASPSDDGGSSASGSSGSSSGSSSSDRADEQTSRSADRTPAPTATSANAVTVDITALSPQVLTPTDTLTLTATITNGTKDPLQGAEANLMVRTTSFTTRDQLTAWSTGNYPQGAVYTARSIALPATLAPGASTSVTFSLSAGSFGWSTAADSWGPQGISVEVATNTGVVAKEPTFLIWLPSPDVGTTDISVLVPLVAADSMPASSADLTRISNVVNATEDYSAVSWALDPSLLVSTAASTGSTSTSQLMKELSGASGSKDIHLMPYADPDIAAIAHSGNSAFYAQAVHDAITAASQTGVTWGSAVDIAWPTNSKLDQETIDMVAGVDPGATIVTTDSALPAADQSSATPSSATEVTTSGGAQVPVLAADSQLSNEFVAVNPADPASIQLLLADTAMTTLDNVGTTRHIVITTPRNWDGDADATSAAFSAMSAAPWIQFETVSQAAAATEGSVARATPPASQVDPTEITPSQLGSLTSAKNQLSAFANVTDDPTSFMASNERILLGPISTVYRSNTQARATALSQVLDSITKTVNQVSIVQGSSINLIADSGEIPITVQNSSSQSVNVTVSMQSHDPRLKVDQSVPAQIAAKSQTTVRIPVEAIANGDVQLDVVLQNPNGQTFTTVDSLTVRVHADWENVGTAVVAGLTALAFVIGLTRTIRRRRRARREVQP